MDQITLAEFAKTSENKEGAEFTQAVQEAGIAQGSLIVSRLYNTMLGEITRVMKSWNAELVKVLQEAGINPTALSNEQLYSALIQLIKVNTNGLQIGDIIPNIGTTSPVGRVLCNGQRLVNCKGLFPDFYNYVKTKTPYKTVSEWNSQKNTYGQCGFCAIDGDDVIVPLITRPISGVSNLSQCGQAVQDTIRKMVGNVGRIHLPDRGSQECTAPFKATNIVHTGVGQDGDAPNQNYVAQLDTSTLGANFNGTETRGKQIQYPYYIQVYTGTIQQSLADTAVLVDMLKYQNQLGLVRISATGGNISLSAGGMYTLLLDSDANFVLPNVSDATLLSQIMIQLTIASENLNIDWGTTKYFNSNPSTSVGTYNVFYEYDVLNSVWVLGQIEKV